MGGGSVLSELLRGWETGRSRQGKATTMVGAHHREREGGRVGGEKERKIGGEALTQSHKV